MAARPTFLRRRLRVVVVIATALGVAAAAFALIAAQRDRTIGEAGFGTTDYILVGGSHVADQGRGQFKESLLRVDGGMLRGDGSIVRVADQQQGRASDCLDQRYAEERYWTSATAASGEIEFRDATSFELLGTISLSVTVVEVVLRPSPSTPFARQSTGPATERVEASRMCPDRYPLALRRDVWINSGYSTRAPEQPRPMRPA